METESMAAGNGRSLHPVALFCLRVNASAILLPGNALVVFEYYEFQQTLNQVLPMMYTGRLSLPTITYLAMDYGGWAVVVASAGVIAAIIYIWAAAQRTLPIILATISAASLCVIAGNAMQVATTGAWKWDAERHPNRRTASQP